MSVEYELARLIEKELMHHARVEKLKQELECCYDFSLSSCFKAIDDINYGYIDHNALKRFLRNVGHVGSDKEITAIIRRIDLDADSRLNP